MTESITINSVTDIFSGLPTVNANATFWMVRANKGEYYDDFVMRQYVGIGFDEISLEEAQSQTNEQLHLLFKDRRPKDNAGKAIPDGTYTSWIGQLKRFANELKPGDYVLVPSDSSERFSLGVITDSPYEYTVDQVKEVEEVAGRKNSPYRKRISVQFLKSFNRKDADPALYKMIYTQTTLSKIDKYVPYILRAAYDAYISGNELYLTFPVKQKENIKGRAFTSFMYHLTEGYYSISDDDPVIKSNVQSAGIVQLVLALSIPTGIFGLLVVCLRSTPGFTVDINLNKGKFRFKKEDKGIVAERIKQAESERKSNEKDAELDRIKKTVDIMNHAGMPMDEIQAKTSEMLSEATKNADSSEEDDQNQLH